MKIFEVVENKRDYMDLLLLADEQEDMVNRYLDRGTMYVLEDNGTKGECVVTDEGVQLIDMVYFRKALPVVHFIDGEY